MPTTPPPLLFKYLSPDRIDVLRDQRIRYTQLAAFNDPFEGRPSLPSVATTEDARAMLAEALPWMTTLAHAGMSEELKTAVSQEAFAEIFSLVRDQFLDSSDSTLAPTAMRLRDAERKELYDEVNLRFGVLSLSEVPDNLLMWAHYGASHSGFVLGFDTTHSYFNQAKSIHDELRHLRSVQYRPSRPEKALRELLGEDLFLIKHVQWQYEKEWRILRALSEASLRIETRPHPICLFSYPPTCLRQVILGARSTDALTSTLTSIIQEDPSLEHVELRRATLDERTYVVRFT